MCKANIRQAEVFRLYISHLLTYSLLVFEVTYVPGPVSKIIVPTTMFQSVHELALVMGKEGDVTRQYW